MNAASIIRAIEAHQQESIIIIGDVMVDAYYRGRVDRISPEAPVPVLSVGHREHRLGGAANVAMNIRGMNYRPILCAVVGEDVAGDQVMELMEGDELDGSGIVRVAHRTTTLKTRLMSGTQQLIRVDEEETTSLDDSASGELWQRIQDVVKATQPSAIIFEDYDKGVIDARLIKRVVDLAATENIPVTVDPKRRNFFSYSGVDLFKPNLRELRDGLGREDFDINTEGLSSVFHELHDRMPVKAALFTLADQGVFVTDGEAHSHQPAHERSIADVSGAGDTVISVATCALLSGLSLPEVAFISNLAGGWVCQFPGVISLQWNDLKQELTNVLPES